jgi:hypothetical protein
LEARILNPKLLPLNFIKCMSKVDRELLGVQTKDEMAKAWQARSERDLQRQIVQYLRLRGIEVIHHAMNKKSTATRGTPDILFCVMVQGFPRAVAIEVKFGSGICSRQQNDMMERMKTRPNSWDVRIVRTFTEVVDLMREYGL